jgi:RNA polymerase sigma-70 factor (ECF subfamily)
MFRTDADLLQACQRGDARAQAALYDRFRRSLMGVCLRYARHRADAEDIFQEAFVKIFRNLTDVRQPETLAAWVRRVVVNTAITHYHHEKTRQTADLDAAPDAADDAVVLTQLGTDELLRLIQALPDGYRLVFNLYVIEGHTHPEIGRMLNISENTSKSQLARAKAWLRRELRAVGIVRYETD